MTTDITLPSIVDAEQRLLQLGAVLTANHIPGAEEDILALSFELKRLRAQLEDMRNHHKIAVDGWTLEAQTVKQLEDEAHELRGRLAKFEADHICLVCGRSEPCMTEEEVEATGGPGVPCTFDPTPRELFEENRRLRARISELGETLKKARECAMWHVADGDECGQLARALIADIDVKKEG